MTHPAIEFLRHLDGQPEARFNIESYTDAPKGLPKPRPDPLLSRRADLSIEDIEALVPQLEAFNAQGGGIFVTRNECTGQRCAEAVSRVRGVHADMDDVTQLQLDRLFAHLPPRLLLRPVARVGSRSSGNSKLARRSTNTPS